MVKETRLLEEIEDLVGNGRDVACNVSTMMIAHNVSDFHFEIVVETRASLRSLSSSQFQEFHINRNIYHAPVFFGLFRM